MTQTEQIVTKKPVLLENGHTDEMFTPNYALNPLVTYLDCDWVIWECAWGSGSLATHLKNRGYTVVGNPQEDFMEVEHKCNVIVTNPPYSMKEKFLRRAYSLEIPFAFLLPLTALEGIQRGEMYAKYGIDIIIPNRRINFITPNSGKSSWFATAWFTCGLHLPKELNFVELNREAQDDTD